MPPGPPGPPGPPPWEHWMSMIHDKWSKDDESSYNTTQSRNSYPAGPPPPPPYQSMGGRGEYNGSPSGPPPGSPDEADWGDDWEYPKKDDHTLALGLGIGIPLLILLLAAAIIIACIISRRRRKRENAGANHSVFPMPMPMPPPKSSNLYQNYDGVTVESVDPWELHRQNVIVYYDKKLGSGAFCNVFKGKILGDAPAVRMKGPIRVPVMTNADVAVKMLPSFADDLARSDFMQEINFMKSLNYHPHLVSMLGWVADRKSPMLLVEFCEKGDLLHFIRERKQEILTGYQNTEGLKVKDILSFSWQIANGLEYLNSVGCIHRDIAARNVLVDATNVCKIGDFGLCRLTDSLLYQARGGRLPLKWMAPEALSSLEYSFKSDVWSYGVLLWELYSLGEVPFATLQTTDLLPFLQRGQRLEKPTLCTQEVYEVLLKCWSEDPNARPSFTQLCTFFGGFLERATESYGYLVPIGTNTNTASTVSATQSIDTQPENSQGSGSLPPADSTLRIEIDNV